MKQEKITQELLEKIIVDYKNGMTPKQMSDKYIINAGTIISRLQSIGIYKNTTYRFTEADLQYLKDHYPKEDIIMKKRKILSLMIIMQKMIKISFYILSKLMRIK